MPEPETIVRTKRPRYREFACKMQALLNCIEADNSEWEANHREWLEKECKNGPSGSGIDSGTHIDLDKSSGEKLVFETAYHHMDEGGCYDGWTTHSVIVTPSLQFVFQLRITGRDRNQIKEYLYDVYSNWLREEVEIS